MVHRANRMSKPPITLAHDSEGVVHEMGDNVKGFKIGTLVSVEANV